MVRKSKEKLEEGAVKILTSPEMTKIRIIMSIVGTWVLGMWGSRLVGRYLNCYRKRGEIYVNQK